MITQAEREFVRHLYETSPFSDPYPIMNRARDICRRDTENVFEAFPTVVDVLLDRLKKGEIDGTSYISNQATSYQPPKECFACLIGTLATAAAGKLLEEYEVREIAREHNRLQDVNSPAESWFLFINPGDTPENNPFCKDAVMWVEEWLKERSTWTVLKEESPITT